MPITSPNLSLANEHLNQALSHLSAALTATTDERTDSYFSAVREARFTAYGDVCAYHARLMDALVAVKGLCDYPPMGPVSPRPGLSDDGPELDATTELGATVE